MTNPFLVSCEWLANRLDQEDISIVDGTWFLPTMNRDGRSEYDQQHIPGAVFFDIDGVTEPGSNLPHTLASAGVFAQKVGQLGISDRDTIVVYDGLGLFSAARVWWNFRLMGAAKVVILDGGMPKWLELRLPLEAGEAVRTPNVFNASLQTGKIAGLNEMLGFVETGSRQIADARPSGRFTGAEPEPRAGIRSGHMPGAKNVPFSALADNGHLKSTEELRAVFSQSGIDLSKPVVTTCGSGVTAAALILALETVGHNDHILYDGSWAEWGSKKDTVVVAD